MNRIRLTNVYAPDLRPWQPLERLGRAFETSAHTVDVRHVNHGEGKYNIPNIGIFFWRLTAFSLHAWPAAGIDAHRCLFNPLGANMPLFNNPQSEKSITHLAEPGNVHEPISRRVLAAALSSCYRPDLSMFIDGVPSANVAVCHLSPTPTRGHSLATAQCPGHLTNKGLTRRNSVKIAELKGEKTVQTLARPCSPIPRKTRRKRPRQKWKRPGCA